MKRVELIDLDRLRGRFHLLTFRNSADLVMVRKEINQAPVVDAIPIEWIKQYEEENFTDGVQFGIIYHMLEAWKNDKSRMG